MELKYKELIADIVNNGDYRISRNGNTISVFGKTLSFDLSDGTFPILTGRKIYYKGVLGELAALLRQPKHIDDFRKQGCNYWDAWAKEDGSINVDYGNKWLDWNGVNQLEKVLDTIKNNPNDRRMIITGWDPSSVDDLDLPCCHYTYQWYVRGDYLDLLWHQRSVDTMVGLPSDIVFAAAWNIIMANETGLKPGKVTMTLGDTHIYEEHLKSMAAYLAGENDNIRQPKWKLHRKKGDKVVDFTPDMLELIDYNPLQNLRFELKV